MHVDLHNKHFHKVSVSLYTTQQICVHFKCCALRLYSFQHEMYSEFLTQHFLHRDPTHMPKHKGTVCLKAVLLPSAVFEIWWKKGKSKGWETCRKSHSFVAFDCATVCFINPLDDLRSLCTCSRCKYFQNYTLNWENCFLYIVSVMKFSMTLSTGIVSYSIVWLHILTVVHC